MQLKQLVPEEFCLRCDVCCRFSQAHTVWAPLFTDSEIKYLVKKNILPALVFTGHSETKIAKDRSGSMPICIQRINLIEHNGCFICPCFNPSDHSCKIYADRPFECQLYPFLLMRKDDKFYLVQDKKCPYLNKIKEPRLKGYINYLKEEFKKEDILSFLRQNQELFAEYPTTDLKLLFSIVV